MKNRVVILVTSLMIVLLGFTINNSDDDYIFILKKYKDKFKHNNLTDFRVDYSLWKSRKDYYGLDSIMTSRVWQGKRNYYKFYDSTYFYSIQNNSRELQEITVLQKGDEAGCFQIYYLIYDKKGKLISDFSLASDCAEGGITYNSNGRFLNDSIYEQKIYSEQMYDIDSIKEILKGDSTLLKTKILKTGQLEEVYRQSWSYTRTSYFK